jgi:hypothetical protein
MDEGTSIILPEGSEATSTGQCLLSQGGEARLLAGVHYPVVQPLLDDTAKRQPSHMGTLGLTLLLGPRRQVSQKPGGHHLDGQARGQGRRAAADGPGAGRAGLHQDHGWPAVTEDQRKWLDRIRAHLVVSLSIDREDFENVPILLDYGGWKAADRTFDGELKKLIEDLNEAMAA